MYFDIASAPDAAGPPSPHMQMHVPVPVPVLPFAPAAPAAPTAPAAASLFAPLLGMYDMVFPAPPPPPLMMDPLVRPLTLPSMPLHPFTALSAQASVNPLVPIMPAVRRIVAGKVVPDHRDELIASLSSQLQEMQQRQAQASRGTATVPLIGLRSFPPSSSASAAAVPLLVLRSIAPSSSASERKPPPPEDPHDDPLGGGGPGSGGPCGRGGGGGPGPIVHQREGEKITVQAWPTAANFLEWRRSITKEVAAISGRGDDLAHHWIHAVESDDATFESMGDPGLFVSLDRKLLKGLANITHGEFKRQQGLKEDEMKKAGQILRGRQALWRVYQSFKG